MLEIVTAEYLSVEPLGFVLSSRQEIAGVQYLRGYAATAVVIEHINGSLGFAKYFGTSPLGSPGYFGSTGVFVFFVISGFIMPYIALRPRTLEPATDPGAFLWRRFARIVPFMWVCIFAWVVLRLAGRGPDAWTDYWPGYARAVVLWPIGTPDPVQLWTLKHEFIFCLLFALTLLPRAGRFLPLILWVLAPLLVLPFLSPTSEEASSAGLLAHFLFHPVNLLFGFGLLLGGAFLRYPSAFRLTVPGGSLVCLGLFAAGIVAIERLNTARTGLPVLNTLIAAAICSAVLYGGICSAPSRFARADRLARLLGDASYSIYMTHGIFLSGAISLAVMFTPWINPAIIFVICLFFCLSAGVLIHISVEVPLVRAVRRLGARGESPASKPAWRIRG